MYMWYMLMDVLYYANLTIVMLMNDISWADLWVNLLDFFNMLNLILIYYMSLFWYKGLIKKYNTCCVLWSYFCCTQ